LYTIYGVVAKKKQNCNAQNTENCGSLVLGYVTKFIAVCQVKNCVWHAFMCKC